MRGASDIGQYYKPCLKEQHRWHQDDDRSGLADLGYSYIPRAGHRRTDGKKFDRRG